MILIYDEQKLVNSILANLPSIHIVVNSVENAIKIAKKHLESIKVMYADNDNVYLQSLRVGLEMSQYLKEKGNVNFFKYELIVVAILHRVLELADSEELRKDLEIFKTTNNKVINDLQTLTINQETVNKMGLSKYTGVRLVKLFNTDIDLFFVEIISVLDNLNALKEIKKSLGYQEDPEKGDLVRSNYLNTIQNVILNFMKAGKVIPNTVNKQYSEIVTILNIEAY